MPYRILHFIDTLGAGGAERQLVYLLANLDRKRFESFVVTTYDVFRHYEAELEQMGIELYSLHHGELSIFNRMRAVTLYAQLTWRLRPNIVHSWLYYPNLIARLARPVCHPHKLIGAIRTEYTPRQQHVENITAGMSDFRIVMSPSQLTPVKSFSQITIPNGVDLTKFSPNYMDSSSQFTLLMVARIDERKDHQTLLEAIASLKLELPHGFRTILVGEVSQLSTQLQLQAVIQQHGLNDLILQQPTTYNIENQYRLADVTVLPSKTEGFPNVVLESFASGKPVIVSEAANKIGLVEHGVSGWVFPTGDSHALANCIRLAFKASHAERVVMGKQGRKIAEAYSIPRMVEQYTQLYERVLNRA